MNGETLKAVMSIAGKVKNRDRALELMRMARSVGMQVNSTEHFSLIIRTAVSPSTWKER